MLPQMLNTIGWADVLPVLFHIISMSMYQVQKAFRGLEYPMGGDWEWRVRDLVRAC